MVTRAEVLAAYAANPKASLTPTEDAIQFWMQGGLGNFNQIVDEARAQNPALAAQIDADRAAAATAGGGGTGGGGTGGGGTGGGGTGGGGTGGGGTGGGVVTGGGGTGGTGTGGGGTGGNVVTGGGGTGGTGVTGTGAVDNTALYRNLVTQAYGGIGRTGFGTGANQIDQSGYNFWLNALQNGTLTPDTFNASFNRSVNQYIAENPNNLITQNVQAYKPFANTGLLSQSQMQPQSMGAPAVSTFQPQSVGAPAVPNYQPQSLAQNFQNYMGIPIGAQYNPAVTAGGASPYSQIKALTPQFVNPYAGVVANTAMGGYNPLLYENVRVADAAAARAASGAAGDGTGGTAAMAKGGYVHGGLMSGPNPPGPDDGAVNLDIGEYVIKKSAVDKYGKGLLDMINEGKVPVKKAKSLLF